MLNWQDCRIEVARNNDDFQSFSPKGTNVTTSKHDSQDGGAGVSSIASQSFASQTSLYAVCQ